MLEPLILTDELIDLAVAWQDECFRRWDELDGLPAKIAEITLTSPVDGSLRETWLLLGRLKIAPAKTCLGLFTPEGKVADGGFTVVLDDSLQDSDAQFLTAVLLHEIAHVVDPYHDSDCKMRSADPDRFRTVGAQYALASEQRAFTAMWTWRFREAIRAGHQLEPRKALQTLRNMDLYFRGFLDYGQLEVPHLWEQTEEHFRRIIDDLMRRHAMRTAE